MADLPKWARTEEGEEGGGTLGDKLVDKPEDEEGEDKPPTLDEPDEGGLPMRTEESALASRALCFFRMLAIITVILALVVIGTNCYIIYKRFEELKGK